MDRIGITAATAVGLSLILTSASVVLAKESGTQEDRGNGQAGLSAQLQVQADVNVGRGSDKDDEATTSERVGDDNDKNKGDSARTDADVRAATSTNVSEDDGDDVDDDLNDDKGGKGEGEKHRSVVADVVQSLKNLADRDGGIGDEVRAIAQEQASSSEHAAEVMAKVEARSSLLAFLFGAGFWNIGALRSELATTANHIERLTKAKDRVINADVKAGIDAQISALEKANADANAFVQANEDTFSVFGWFSKLFSK